MGAQKTQIMQYNLFTHIHTAHVARCSYIVSLIEVIHTGMNEKINEVKFEEEQNKISIYS